MERDDPDLVRIVLALEEASGNKVETRPIEIGDLPEELGVEDGFVVGSSEGISLTEDQFLAFLERVGYSQEEITILRKWHEEVVRLEEVGLEAKCKICYRLHSQVAALEVTKEGFICNDCREDDDTELLD